MTESGRRNGAICAGLLAAVTVGAEAWKLIERGSLIGWAAGIAMLAVMLWGGVALHEYQMIADRRAELLRKNKIPE